MSVSGLAPIELHTDQELARMSRGQLEKLWESGNMSYRQKRAALDGVGVLGGSTKTGTPVTAPSSGKPRR